jgi:hypothetical protein
MVGIRSPVFGSDFLFPFVFLLLATLQIQRAIFDQFPESPDRPHVGVDNIEMIPLQVGRNIDVDLKTRNSGLLPLQTLE